MADRIKVDYDLRLPSGGFVRLGIDTARCIAADDQAFILSVMDKVTEFARACNPEAPAPAEIKPEPPHEVIGQFGPTRKRVV